MWLFRIRQRTSVACASRARGSIQPVAHDHVRGQTNDACKHTIGCTWNGPLGVAMRVLHRRISESARRGAGVRLSVPQQLPRELRRTVRGERRAGCVRTVVLATVVVELAQSAPIYDSVGSSFTRERQPCAWSGAVCGDGPSAATGSTRGELALTTRRLMIEILLGH